jgi:hypothetical protein
LMRKMRPKAQDQTNNFHSHNVAKRLPLHPSALPLSPHPCTHAPPFRPSTFAPFMPGCFALCPIHGCMLRPSPRSYTHKSSLAPFMHACFAPVTPQDASEGVLRAKFTGHCSRARGARCLLLARDRDWQHGSLPHQAVTGLPLPLCLLTASQARRIVRQWPLDSPSTYSAHARSKGRARTPIISPQPSPLSAPSHSLLLQVAHKRTTTCGTAERPQGGPLQSANNTQPTKCPRARARGARTRGQTHMGGAAYTFARRNICSLHQSHVAALVGPAGTRTARHAKFAHEPCVRRIAKERRD